MKVSQATVFEFGYLCSDAVKAQEQGYCFIPEADFAYLEQRCLTDDNSGFNQIMQPRIRQGCRLLQVRNYVGVIFVPSGNHIEVLPKTGITESVTPSKADFQKARQTLLIMLQALGEFRYIALDSSSIETLKLPLLEIFIARFLHTIQTVVKRGLRSDYVPQQENLLTKRGKLNIGQQVKHNFIHKQRFFCEFDEYRHDRPANRLLKSALLSVSRYSHDANNQKWLRELLFYFDDVPASCAVKQDFSQLHLDRSMAHYKPALAWARLILNDLSPASMKGKADAPSLLFPMEAVFESYVAQTLRKQLPNGYHLRTQARGKYLASHNDKNMFLLKPDLMIEQEGKPICVLDTKWKRINGNDSANHYGLSQSDFYQMFAYGQKYLSGEGELVLIYPKTDSFDEPIANHFVFQEGLNLWIAPFVIDSQQGIYLQLNEAMKQKIAAL